MVGDKRTGRFLEWYPGNGPHHKDPHWKFSSGESGTLRTNAAGIEIAIALIPGASYAAKGDWNGAARDVAIEFSPLAWSKMGWEALGAFYDQCERDLYGEDYQKRMEQTRKDFWDEKQGRK